MCSLFFVLGAPASDHGGRVLDRHTHVSHTLLEFEFFEGVFKLFGRGINPETKDMIYHRQPRRARGKPYVAVMTEAQPFALP